MKLCINHRRIGRFRILGEGGQGLEYWGSNSQQAHDVVTTSMRRNNVAPTSFRRHVPTRLLKYHCQIITFLILKSHIIENSRIELRGTVLPVPSNQIKVTFIIILPFNLVHLPDSHKTRHELIQMIRMNKSTSQKRVNGVHDSIAAYLIYS